MAATATQKRLYLHHQDEFQHNYYVVVSLHHSDHGGVVRIFVGRSEVVKRLLITLFTLFTRHFISYTRSVIFTRHNFSYTRSVTLRGTIFPLPGV